MKLKIKISILACFLYVNMLSAQSDFTATLKVGDTIPDVELLNMDFTPMKLSTDQKGQPLVIIFYRGNWCPYCNAYLSDLQPYFKPLMKLGYKLVAISTETANNLKKTAENNYLKYTLLSDAAKTAINKFGIVNGTFAVPSVFITDKDHIIKFIYTNKDYKIRYSGEEIYNKASALNKK